MTARHRQRRRCNLGKFEIAALFGTVKGESPLLMTRSGRVASICSRHDENCRRQFLQTAGEVRYRKIWSDEIRFMSYSFRSDHSRDLKRNVTKTRK